MYGPIGWSIRPRFSCCFRWPIRPAGRHDRHSVCFWHCRFPSHIFELIRQSKLTPATALATAVSLDPLTASMGADAQPGLGVVRLPGKRRARRPGQHAGALAAPAIDRPDGIAIPAHAPGVAIATLALEPRAVPVDAGRQRK